MLLYIRDVWYIYVYVINIVYLNLYDVYFVYDIFLIVVVDLFIFLY